MKTAIFTLSVLVVAGLGSIAFKPLRATYSLLASEVSCACDRVSDSLALVNLYKTNGGGAWTYNISTYYDGQDFIPIPNAGNAWIFVTPIDQWHGVSLSEAGCVESLTIPQNNLTGVLPNLTLGGLKVLDLSKNNLMGEIPPFERLVFLEFLNGSSNQFTGNIPDFYLPSLDYLSFADNQLEGAIPNFSGLPLLYKLNLSYNNLNGTIPNFFALSDLSILLINNNNLVGNIPNFSNLPDLLFLNCSSNLLTGAIPNFDKLPELLDLNCAYNELDGSIPDFSNLPRLSGLIAQYNNLTGALPDLSDNCPALTKIYLQGNQLTGCFPEGMRLFCGIGFAEEVGQDGYNFLDNVGLSWKGDFEQFCANSPQLGAICDDGNITTTEDRITSDCICQGTSDQECATVRDTITDVICYNESEYIWNGEVYTEPGIYTQTLTTVEGCDSLLTLDLQFGFRPHADIYGDSLLCGETTTVLTGIGGSFYEWSNGETTKEITVGLGTYTVTVTNAAGCMDTWTTTVKTASPVTDTITDVICYNESEYIWNGEVYTEPGLYTQTLTTEEGCDSLLTLDLQFGFRPHADIYGDSLLCGETTTVLIGIGGSIYEWSNGETTKEITAGLGTYTVTVTNAAGCIDTWTTTVRKDEELPVLDCIDVITVNSINNEPTVVEWDEPLIVDNCGNYDLTSSHEPGMVFPVGTTKVTYIATDRTGNMNSCTFSVVVTGETCNESETDAIVTICQGEAYELGDEIYTESGSYAQVLTSSLGCDSIVNLTLNVLEIINSAVGLTQEFCEGASLPTLRMNVEPDETVDWYTNPIGGEPVLEGSTFFRPDSAGNYYAAIRNIEYGCVSEERTLIELLALPNYEIEVTEFVCDPQAIGTETLALLSSGGCDSVVTVNRVFQPTIETILTRFTCDPAQAGRETLRLESQNGCDSLVITDYFLATSDTTFLAQTSCNPNEAGVNVSVATNLSGCDSVIVTTTTWIEPNETVLEEVICTGQEFEFGEIILTTEGEYQQILRNQYGCDSIVNLFLELIDLTSDSEDQFIEVCEGDQLPVLSIPSLNDLETLDWYDAPVGGNKVASDTPAFLPSEAGIYYAQIRNAVYGCVNLDRIRFDLQWLETSITENTFYVCDASEVRLDTTVSLNENGCEVLTIADYQLGTSPITNRVEKTCDPRITGIDTLIFPNQYNCDSLVVIERQFEENNSIQTDFRFTCNPNEVGLDTTYLELDGSCQGLLITTVFAHPTTPPTFVDQFVCEPTLAGLDTLPLVNQYGCDSLIIFRNTYIESPVTTQEKYSCEIASIRIDTFYLQTFYGCDSVIIAKLLPAEDSPVTQLLEGTCDPTLAGTSSQLYQNQFGCDSLVEVSTTYIGSTPIFVTETTCDRSFLGQIDTTSLINQNGCDSLIITSYIVQPNSADTYLAEFTCDTKLADTEDTLFLQNRFGCDSLVITLYLLDDMPIVERTEFSCTPLTSLQDTFRFTRVDACDSMVIVSYIDVSTPPLFESLTTCDPMQAARDTLFLTNQFNCDSLIIRDFELLATPTPTVLEVTTCRANELENDTLVLRNQSGCDSLVITTYDYVPIAITTQQQTSCTFQLPDTSSILTTAGCDSMVVINYNYEPIQTNITDRICEKSTYDFNGNLLTEAGTYQDTLSTQNGCDSLITLTLEMNAAIEETIEAQLCAGESYEFAGTVLFSSGSYEHIFQTSDGCDSTVFLILESLAENEVIVQDDTITLLAQDGRVNFDVLQNDLLPDAWELTILYPPTNGSLESSRGNFTYQLNSAFSEFTGVDQFAYLVCSATCPDVCQAGTVTINITRTCIDELTSTIPTAFSPMSDDPLNQIFDPLGGITNECFEQPTNAKLMIYSTAGELVFTTRNQYQAWDGQRKNGKVLPTGTYYYTLSFDLNGEPTEPLMGWVTLLVER